LQHLLIKWDTCFKCRSTAAPPECHIAQTFDGRPDYTIWHAATAFLITDSAGSIGLLDVIGLPYVFVAKIRISSVHQLSPFFGLKNQGKS
jgi:hypothetical protein